MTTIHTYNRLKELVEPEKFEYALKIFRECESEGLILGGKDYNRSQLRLFVDNLKFPTVEYSNITDPVEYEDKFDELIEDLLYDLCRIKGLDSISIESEMLSNIREQIVDVMHGYGYDLSSPQKEYNVGEKVKLTWNSEIVNATIVLIGYDRYGLLIDESMMVVLIGEDVDNATNYIIKLQKNHNVYAWSE